uniref:G-protein coupled receptors family 1 profile domain-containing protein n=1 Tax=Balaenoptera musculus TaxID=9771 RepID=A0A8C0CUM3_BALMU
VKLELVAYNHLNAIRSNGTDLRDRPNPGEVATASIFFGALWLFSVFGNSLVCLVIHRSRRTQSTTNYFVVSLACADLLISVAGMPFVLLQFTTGRWALGSNRHRWSNSEADDEHRPEDKSENYQDVPHFKSSVFALLAALSCCSAVAPA